ncbi:MAG: hypothetical protein AAF550_10590 [Myxococcota bacterium]
MTEVTESVKHLPDEPGHHTLEYADLEVLCREPRLVKKFASMIVAQVQEFAPGRRWTLEDLKDVLDNAAQGAEQQTRAQVLAGRHFRKKLREQSHLAARHGDRFSCVVLSLDELCVDDEYPSVLDAVLDRLRGSDMVFLYRRKLALILPGLGSEALTPLLDRVQALVSFGSGESTLASIDALVCPNDIIETTEAVLDWAENRLR